MGREVPRVRCDLFWLRLRRSRAQHDFVRRRDIARGFGILLVTDGGFRPDGTFVSWPAHDTARLTEAFRRAVLRPFVRLDLFDEDQAAGMLTWPHSGFHVHTAVWDPEDDRAFATRLARYCARNPVALERLTYDCVAKVVTYRSDKSEGPTAGTETADALEFLARVLTHIPDKGQVTTRYYGWYGNRPRGRRRQAEPAAADAALATGKESLGISPLAMSTTSFAREAESHGRLGCFAMRGKLTSAPKSP
jgi:Putative transposase